MRVHATKSSIPKHASARARPASSSSSPSSLPSTLTTQGNNNPVDQQPIQHAPAGTPANLYLLQLARTTPSQSIHPQTQPPDRARLHPQAASSLPSPPTPDMGCGFSSPTGCRALRPFAGVRVIHTNGYVQDFDIGPTPVTVAHATASTGSGSSNSTRYVLCSSAHLLQPGRALFRPDDPLQPGSVYFLLPHSVFQAESSAVDLACLMNRLTALARKGGGAPPCPVVDALFDAAEDQATTTKPHPAGSGGKCCAAAGKSRAAWRPQLDRIDESIGRSSRRSTASSTCSARSMD